MDQNYSGEDRTYLNVECMMTIVFIQ